MNTLFKDGDLIELIVNGQPEGTEYQIIAGTTPGMWDLKVTKSNSSKIVGHIYPNLYNTKGIEDAINAGYTRIVNTPNNSPTTPLYNIGDILTVIKSGKEYELLAGSSKGYISVKVISNKAVYMNWWTETHFEDQVKQGLWTIRSSQFTGINSPKVSGATINNTPVKHEIVKKPFNHAYDELMAKLCENEGAKIPIRRKPVAVYQPNVDYFDLLKDA